jgi:formylglycine-generating enzyme required for sulfatase activity
MLEPSPVPIRTQRPLASPDTHPPTEPVTISTADGAVAATPEGTRGDASYSSPVDTWVRPVDGMPMVYVPRGTFPMGSTEDDAGAFPHEMPRHYVTLKAFWIDRTEGNNEQYVHLPNEQANSDEQLAGMFVLDRGYTQISWVGHRFVAIQSSREKPVLQ